MTKETTDGRRGLDTGRNHVILGETMTDNTRTVQRSLRLTPTEATRLDGIAAKHGPDWPALVRMLVKKEHDRLVEEVAAKKGKPRR